MNNERRSISGLAGLVVAGGAACAALCGATLGGAAPLPGDSPHRAPDAVYVSHGRFKNVAVYAPSGTPASFVLFLSGDGGWNPQAAAIARELVRHGAMVAGIDLPKFRADLEADDADCVFADGDLENLGHFLQAYFHLPTYRPPFFVGIGAGAGLAYATLAQAPPDTFAGALTLGFCPDSSMRKPLCKGSGLDFIRRPGRRGIEYLPAKQLANPWVLMQGELDRKCGAGTAGAFIADMPGAALVVLPRTDRTYQPPETWLPKFMAAFDTLVKRSSPALTPPAPVDLGGSAGRGGGRAAGGPRAVRYGWAGRRRVERHVRNHSIGRRRMGRARQGRRPGAERPRHPGGRTRFAALFLDRPHSRRSGGGSGPHDPLLRGAPEHSSRGRSRAGP